MTPTPSTTLAVSISRRVRRSVINRICILAMRMLWSNMLNTISIMWNTLSSSEMEWVMLNAVKFSQRNWVYSTPSWRKSTVSPPLRWPWSSLTRELINVSSSKHNSTRPKTHLQGLLLILRWFTAPTMNQRHTISSWFPNQQPKGVFYPHISSWPMTIRGCLRTACRTWPIPYATTTSTGLGPLRSLRRASMRIRSPSIPWT